MEVSAQAEKWGSCGEYRQAFNMINKRAEPYGG